LIVYEFQEYARGLYYSSSFSFMLNMTQCIRINMRRSNCTPCYAMSELRNTLCIFRE